MADEQEVSNANEKGPVLPSLSERYCLLHKDLLGAVGREHPSKTPIKPHVSEKRGTESGTPATTPAPALPDDLAEMVAVWANLPAALKAGILAMVKAAKT